MQACELLTTVDAAIVSVLPELLKISSLEWDQTGPNLLFSTFDYLWQELVMCFKNQLYRCCYNFGGILLVTYLEPDSEITRRNIVMVI